MARRSIVVASVGLALVGGVTACGRVDPKEKPDASRPPAEAQISAAITANGVNVSPGEIGGGPIRIIISNQTQQSLRAVLTSSSGEGDRQTPHPIDPGAVAAIQAEVSKGTYRLAVGGDRVKAADIVVGRRRPSSDGALLLP